MHSLPNLKMSMCVCGYKTGNRKKLMKGKHQNERSRLPTSLLYTILQKRNGWACVNFFHWTIQAAISLAERNLDNAFIFRVVVEEEQVHGRNGSFFDYPEDGGNKLLRNVGNELMINTSSYLMTVYLHQ